MADKLRSVDELPLKYQYIFSDYKYFNIIQSKVFEDIFNTSKSIIISAPTGSGKTAVFELAIVKLLMNLPHNYDNFKIVYVAPIKALCSEKYTEWSKKFNPLGISTREVTGDSDIIDFTELNTINLIITTPEKWDSLTRRWKDNVDCANAVELFLIDEVHLLNEDLRGPILEAIVSRMKTIQKIKRHDEGKNLRFIAASATIPNIEDLSVWLEGRHSVSYFHISEEQRPVQLEKHILGYSSNAVGFKFDMSLNYKLAGIIRKYSEGKPTLIFCNSRKSVEMATTVLSKESPLLTLSDSHRAALLNISKRLQNNKLQSLIVKAIAFHHAGLGHDDRNLIEEAFRRSLLLVLISTNTLAMGVNLPAHLVIIKSTEIFICGSIKEYPLSSILQMIGRAGRPNYDVKGVAVIMTQQKNVKKYENLMNGCTPIESHLHKHLAEHLNSEIVLHTITDLEIAMDWIKSTFLYVRAVKCPVNYGFSANLTRENVEKKLEEMCLNQINALETNGLIIKDQAFGTSICATQYGRLMARYYISLDTMKRFREVTGNEQLVDILKLIISCKEFSEFTIRTNDKKTLNSINAKSIRFPIKGRVKTVENKVYCLIQAILGNIAIQEPSLIQDALKMARLAERISKCIVEFIRLSEKRLGGRIFQALYSSLVLAKCLRAKLWENTEYVCKQLKKIGTTYSNLLVSVGKTTLESLINTDPRTLEMILKKAPPFGEEIHEGLNNFPEYNLQLNLKASGIGEVIVKQTKETYSYSGKNCAILIGDTENSLIFYQDKIDGHIEEFGIYEKTFKIPNILAEAIHAHIVHESFVGVDRTATLILNQPDDFEKSTKVPAKKKVQSKLRVTRSANQKQKNRVPIEINAKSLEDIQIIDEDYDPSLFLDEEYFTDLNVLCDLDMNDSNIVPQRVKMNSCDTSKDISQKVSSSKENPLKRKLESFSYTERNKLNKSRIEDDKLQKTFENDYAEKNVTTNNLSLNNSKVELQQQKNEDGKKAMSADYISTSVENENLQNFSIDENRLTQKLDSSIEKRDKVSKTGTKKLKTTLISSYLIKNTKTNDQSTKVNTTKQNLEKSIEKSKSEGHSDKPQNQSFHFDENSRSKHENIQNRTIPGNATFSSESLFGTLSNCTNAQILPSQELNILNSEIEIRNNNNLNSNYVQVQDITSSASPPIPVTPVEIQKPLNLSKSVEIIDLSSKNDAHLSVLNPIETEAAASTTNDEPLDFTNSSLNPLNLCCSRKNNSIQLPNEMNAVSHKFATKNYSPFANKINEPILINSSNEKEATVKSCNIKRSNATMIFNHNVAEANDKFIKPNKENIISKEIAFHNNSILQRDSMDLSKSKQVNQYNRLNYKDNFNYHHDEKQQSSSFMEIENGINRYMNLEISSINNHSLTSIKCGFPSKNIRNNLESTNDTTFLLTPELCADFNRDNMFNNDHNEKFKGIKFKNNESKDQSFSPGPQHESTTNIIKSFAISQIDNNIKKKNIIKNLPAMNPKNILSPFKISSNKRTGWNKLSRININKNLKFRGEIMKKCRILNSNNYNGKKKFQEETHTGCGTLFGKDFIIKKDNELSSLKMMRENLKKYFESKKLQQNKDCNGESSTYNIIPKIQDPEIKTNCPGPEIKDSQPKINDPERKTEDSIGFATISIDFFEILKSICDNCELLNMDNKKIAQIVDRNLLRLQNENDNDTGKEVKTKKFLTENLLDKKLSKTNDNIIYKNKESQELLGGIEIIPCLKDISRPPPVPLSSSSSTDNNEKSNDDFRDFLYPSDRLKALIKRRQQRIPNPLRRSIHPKSFEIQIRRNSSINTNVAQKNIENIEKEKLNRNTLWNWKRNNSNQEYFTENLPTGIENPTPSLSSSSSPLPSLSLYNEWWKIRKNERQSIEDLPSSINFDYQQRRSMCFTEEQGQKNLNRLRQQPIHLNSFLTRRNDNRFNFMNDQNLSSSILASENTEKSSNIIWWKSERNNFDNNPFMENDDDLFNKTSSEDTSNFETSSSLKNNSNLIVENNNFNFDISSNHSFENFLQNLPVENNENNEEISFNTGNDSAYYTEINFFSQNLPMYDDHRDEE